MDDVLSGADLRLASELSASYGPAVGAFYEESCRTISRNQPTTTHVVGHLMREIEGSVRAVLLALVPQTPPEPATEEQNSHRRDIARILDSLRLRSDDPLPALWNSFVGELAPVAHRGGQNGPRPVDFRFLDLWRRFRLFLTRAAVLQQEHVARHLAILDELLSVQSPTKAQISSFTREIPHGASSLRYFFDNLAHAGWLEPLRNKGYFAQAPGPIQVDGGQRFPPWAPTGYLTRMVPERPAVVGSVLAEVEPNGNWRVIDDLIDVALELDATYSAQFADRLANWIRAADWFPSFRPALVGKLACHVAAGGQPEAGLDLMSAALALLPEDRAITEGGEPEFQLRSSPRTRLRESYEYGEAIHATFPGLVRTAGLAWLDLLGGLLSESIALASRPPRIPPEDHSAIWRNAIEAHPEDLHDRDARGHLVSALRDAAVVWVSENPTQLQPVLDLLWDAGWHICKRIALHVVAECAAAAPDGVARVIQQREVLDLYALRHEAGRMFNAAWPSLNEEDRSRVLDWIEHGPLDEGLEPGKREWWQLRWLVILRAVLDDRRLTLLENLVSKHGEPEHPDLVSHTSTAVWVTESPFQQADLVKLSLDEIESLLEQWEPSGEWLDPSYEGLGRALRVVASQRAIEFAANAQRWRSLRNTYVRNILDGFTDAARDGADLDWDQVLAFCSFVLDQPWTLNPVHVPFGVDPDWSWARQAAARLIEAGLIARTPIPPAFRARVWNLISRLAEDEEPSSDSEEHDREGGMDSFTRSINCTRGVAVHAAIHYGGWLHRAGVVSTQTFAAMPELPALLERRLDRAIDATACIRSVLAHHIQRLVWLDKAWAYSHRTSIFIWSQKQTSLSLDVWHAYTGFSGVAEGVADVLIEDYFEALRMLAGKDVSHDTQSTMTHLAIMWLSAKPIDVDIPSRIFELGDDPLSAAFVDGVEDLLSRRSEQFWVEDAKKVLELWAMRLDEAAADPGGQSAELVAWASVFSWDGLPVAESGRLLLRTLNALILREPQSGGVSRFDTRQMIAQLVECSREQPLLAMQALVRLIELDRDGWLFTLVKADIRECIEIAVASGDGEAEREARAVANRLVGRGHPEFRDLTEPSIPA